MSIGQRKDPSVIPGKLEPAVAKDLPVIATKPKCPAAQDESTPLRIRRLPLSPLHNVSVSSRQTHSIIYYEDTQSLQTVSGQHPGLAKESLDRLYLSNIQSIATLSTSAFLLPDTTLRAWSLQLLVSAASPFSF
jgi:hypothetical protein